MLQIDPPRDPKDYLHRAGRTARAGKDGSVVLIATTRQIRSAESMLKAAGVEAIDKRVHVGDAYIAEVTGARDDVAPRKHRTHLKEEQAVRRAIVSYDDDLSDVDHREARPRTARVDDRRFAPRGRDRDGAEARRVERRAERPHYSARRADRSLDDRPRRDDRFGRDERPAYRDRRDERPTRDDRYARDDRPRRDDRFARDERPAYRDRRDDRPARADRARAPRDERRPASTTGNRKQVDKPRWTAKDRKSRKTR